MRGAAAFGMLPLLILSGCGGGGGEVASVPAPPVAAPPPMPVPPTPAPSNYDTAEYRRSNAVAQAQALAAYQSGATGRGVTAGVIDSGIEVGSTEFPNISPLSRDLVGNRGLQAEGDHGIIVSSILLGARNDVRTQGIAPDATLLVLRSDTPGSCTSVTAVSDEGGCTHNDNAIAAGLDTARAAGARVVNISLGGSPANATLRTAIDRATAAGVIIVISAGNEGLATPDPLAQVALEPIAHGLVLVAGATDASQTIASYSNRAGAVAQQYLTALGTRVRFIDAAGTNYVASGTSFSAPVVSGAVALLAQAFPNLTSAQIVDLLLRTTTDLGTAGADAVYGRGEVNLARAFQPQGQASLSATQQPVSLTNNGTLSTAMGDAGSAGLNARIDDMYGREFTVDLAGSIARQPRGGLLAGQMNTIARTVGVNMGGTTLALSIDGRRQARPLLLNDRQRDGARALAGSIVSRLGARTTIALGTGQSGMALIAGREMAGRAAFLTGGSAGAPALPASAQSAFAVRRQLGTVGLTAATDAGRLQLWEQGELGPRGEGLQRYRYEATSVGADWGTGPLALALTATRVRERRTVLGARFSSLLGGGGATSWFGTVNAVLLPGQDWRLGALWTRGRTLVSASGARRRSTIASEALTVDLSQSGLLRPGDTLALRWARPLRVVRGGLALEGLGETAFWNLTPEGRESDLELAYRRPLLGGLLSANVYWRQQPGNYRFATDDPGAALRWMADF